MTSHSKEPWVAGPNILQLVCSEPDQVIVVEPFGMSDSKYLLPHDVRVANARRIVACVNACANLSTEGLEQMLRAGDSLQVRFLVPKDLNDSLMAANFEALPNDGLVWVCLNAEGMPPAGIRAHLDSLTDLLTKAKAEGRTSAQFLLTASLWPGQMQIQALPDEELARIGLVRSDVMRDERQELAANLEKVIAERVAQRDELLMALEALVAKAECFGMGNSTDEYVAAQAVIAKARGVA